MEALECFFVHDWWYTHVWNADQEIQTSWNVFKRKAVTAINCYLKLQEDIGFSSIWLCSVQKAAGWSTTARYVTSGTKIIIVPRIIKAAVDLISLGVFNSLKGLSSFLILLTSIPWVVLMVVRDSCSIIIFMKCSQMELEPSSAGMKNTLYL